MPLFARFLSFDSFSHCYKKICKLLFKSVPLNHVLENDIYVERLSALHSKNGFKCLCASLVVVFFYLSVAYLTSCHIVLHHDKIFVLILRAIGFLTVHYSII